MFVYLLIFGRWVLRSRYFGTAYMGAKANCMYFTDSGSLSIRIPLLTSLFSRQVAEIRNHFVSWKTNNLRAFFLLVFLCIVFNCIDQWAKYVVEFYPSLNMIVGLLVQLMCAAEGFSVA